MILPQKLSLTHTHIKGLDRQMAFYKSNALVDIIVAGVTESYGTGKV